MDHDQTDPNLVEDTVQRGTQYGKFCIPYETAMVEDNPSVVADVIHLEMGR